MPYANSECMNLHLTEISMQVAKGKHAILIIDQARWHTSKKLTVPTNISILPLPPYSPELNPQENVWQWIKAKYLSNRVFASLDEILDAAVLAWNKFAENPTLVKSITSRDWAIL
jgi:transposase